MKLTLAERFAALKILPKETDFTTLKIVRDLQDALSVSEEETKKYEVMTSVSNGYVQTTWNDEGKKEVEIKIGEKATDIIVEALQKLNDEKKLTNEHFTLYEKFVK